eukprot:4940815-Alexandrium_andersonii.AAC.1
MMKQAGTDTSILERMGLYKVADLTGGSPSCAPLPRSSRPSTPSGGPAWRPRGSGGTTATGTSA